MPGDSRKVWVEKEMHKNINDAPKRLPSETPCLQKPRKALPLAPCGPERTRVVLPVFPRMEGGR